MEKGRRHPLHGIHRWWSRRFSTLYRFVLGAYLFDKEDNVIEILNNPEKMRAFSRNKHFYEPFMGGGTGVIEAAYGGWDVEGVDINPIPVKFVRAALKAIKGEVDIKEYLKVAEEIITYTESETRDLWMFDGGIITYLFISRDSVATWLARKKDANVLFCPRCHYIFEARNNPARCPSCGEILNVTQKPAYLIDKSLPLARENWYVFAVERRKGKVREYLSVKRDSKLRRWLEKSAEEARKRSSSITKILEENIDVIEGVRLKREASISTYASLFTWRELATFWSWIQNTMRVENPVFRDYLFIALSEAFKGTSIVVKWHPPINEPVPAGGIKTYWVPHYTVEVNPIARKREFIPAVRNGLVSALRKQKRFFSYLQKSGHVDFNFVIYNKNCVEFDPEVIDLAFVDPPYLDSVKSYASLSLIHHAAVIIERKIMKEKNISLGEIESKEIPRKPRSYRDSMELLLLSIKNSLSPDGRVVFVFNRKDTKDWKIIFTAIKNSGLYPVAAYWTLGETPGGLARSALRGLIVLVLASYPVNNFHAVLDSVIDAAKGVIDQKVELKAISSMRTAFKTVYRKKLIG